MPADCLATTTLHPISSPLLLYVSKCLQIFGNKLWVSRNQFLRISRKRTGHFLRHSLSAVIKSEKNYGKKFSQNWFKSRRRIYFESHQKPRKWEKMDAAPECVFSLSPVFSPGAGSTPQPRRVLKMLPSDVLSEKNIKLKISDIPPTSIPSKHRTPAAGCFFAFFDKIFKQFCLGTCWWTPELNSPFR